jgi:NADH dehydrogenase/NADH:ubiquinone oxidoreductase subunit G
MFKRVVPIGTEKVTVTVEGRSISLPKGDSVAAAVFTAGFRHTRHSAVSGAPRAPYCMMGICFDCLVEINGVPNQQACMTPVQDGMQIKLQVGPRSIEP